MRILVVAVSCNCGRAAVCVINGRSVLVVDCRELINQTLRSGSKLAVQMKPFHERKMLSKLTTGTLLWIHDSNWPSIKLFPSLQH